DIVRRSNADDYGGRDEWKGFVPMSPTNRTSRRGTSLMELITAVSISSLLLVGISSAMLVSLQTLTTSQTSTSTSIQTSQALDKLVTELQSAVYVFERSATAIGFTIADQSGDGYAERIRYSWNGSA